MSTTTLTPTMERTGSYRDYAFTITAQARTHRSTGLATVTVTLPDSAEPLGWVGRYPTEAAGRAVCALMLISGNRGPGYSVDTLCAARALYVLACDMDNSLGAWALPVRPRSSGGGVLGPLGPPTGGKDTMSSYIVNELHIDAMLTGAQELAGSATLYGLGVDEHWPLMGEGATTTGRMLLAQNAAATAYRYSEAVEATDGYEFEPVAEAGAYWSRRAIAGRLAVMVRCYRYQAADGPDWEASEASAFCQALDDLCLRVLTKDEDGWEFGADAFERPGKQLVG